MPSVTDNEFWFEGGRLSLDFIGTLGARSGELLPAPGRLAAWLMAAGLSERSPVVSGPGFARALELRAAISRLVEASLGGSSFQPGDLRLVNAAARAQAPVRSLGLRGGDLVVQEVAADLDQCLGVIARDAIDVLTGRQRSLLRACAADDCSGVYLDLSRGGRRKWCTASGCGNRTRVSAHRERHKTTTSTTAGGP